MKTFPLFLKTTGRLVVVFGGGEQAAQKVRLLKKSDACIRVISPRLNPELSELAGETRIEHVSELNSPEGSRGAAIAFAATGCLGANAALAATARSQGALINAVDAPNLCDAYVPSIVDRDPVVVAIGTEGTAPVLAGQIKTKIEGMLEVRLGDFAAFTGSLRRAVMERVEPHKRRAFWRWVFKGHPQTAFLNGDMEVAERCIAAAIEEGKAPDSTKAGIVSLVGAGPGSRDLITLRGVERLQNADVIFYDRLIDTGVLELARRDAERICVGKAPGAHSWPQERINGVIAAEAKKGRRVVRLKCGDPGIFGRLAEEIETLDQAGVLWEIVPGVTSASAAAAVAGHPLTDRHGTDTLVITTGHTTNGNPASDIGTRLIPGTRVAIYMGVGQADSIRSALLAQGLSPQLPVQIVQSAGAENEKFVSTTLGKLSAAIRLEGIENPAIIFITNKHDKEITAAVLPRPALDNTSMDEMKAVFSARYHSQHICHSRGEAVRGNNTE